MRGLTRSALAVLVVSAGSVACGASVVDQTATTDTRQPVKVLDDYASTVTSLEEFVKMSDVIVEGEVTASQLGPAGGPVVKERNRMITVSVNRHFKSSSDSSVQPTYSFEQHGEMLVDGEWRPIEAEEEIPLRIGDRVLVGLEEFKTETELVSPEAVFVMDGRDSLRETDRDSPFVQTIERSSHASLTLSLERLLGKSVDSSGKSAPSAAPYARRRPQSHPHYQGQAPATHRPRKQHRSLQILPKMSASTGLNSASSRAACLSTSRSRRCTAPSNDCSASTPLRPVSRTSCGTQ